MDTKATIEIELKGAAQRHPRQPGQSPYGPGGTFGHWKRATYDAEGEWVRDLKDEVKKDVIKNRVASVKKDLYHEERYRIDEEYRKEHDDREAKKEESQTRQNAYRLMIGGYASGFSSIGKIAGGFVGGGAPGAILAGLNVAGEKLTGGINNLVSNLGNTMSFDGMSQLQGFHEAVSSLYRDIPLVGQGIAAVYDSFFKLVNVVDQAAQRLSQYSGVLAVAQADVEVRRIYRDLRNAETLGPQLASYVDAREDLAEKVEELFIKFAPPIITVLTTLLDIFTANIELFVAGFEIFIEIARPAWEKFQELWTALMQWLGVQQNNNNNNATPGFDLVRPLFEGLGQFPVNNPQANPVAAQPLGGNAAPFGAPNVP